MLILKIKNKVVKIWPFSALQKKINLLNDELIIVTKNENKLKNRLELLEKEIALSIDNNNELEKYNFDLSNKIEKMKETQNQLNSDLKEEICKNKQLVKELGELHNTLEKMELDNLKSKSFSSADFWDNIYRNNGTSGTGSYNRLAEFKAEVINKFIKEKGVKTTIEFGCGDGNQLSFINYDYYIGVDVSSYMIDKNREFYLENSKRKFFSTLSERDEYINERYDLSISLDVIFHLIEDEVFSRYMDDLFYVSSKYVVIYSSNHEEFTKWPEYRHRNFMKYIQERIKGWKLEEFIPNKYPYTIGQEDSTSSSDFYLFKKIDFLD